MTYILETILSVLHGLLSANGPFDRNALISLLSTVKQEEEDDASHAGCCERTQDRLTVLWIRGKQQCK